MNERVDKIIHDVLWAFHKVFGKKIADHYSHRSGGHFDVAIKSDITYT